MLPHASAFSRISRRTRSDPCWKEKPSSHPVGLGYNSGMAGQRESCVSLRPATPDDADPAAALIYETAGTLGDYVFGQTGRTGTIRVLALLFREKGHLFSYQHTTLAVSAGEIVGLVQSFPGGDMWKAGFGLVRACLKCFGLRATIRGIRRGYPLAFEPDAQPGEYYVETLAVAPSRRNRGIGRGLLEHAEQRGRELGFPICSLSVLLHNAEAIRFYTRAGYREDLKYLTRLRAPGVEYTGFYRMIKPISGNLPDQEGESRK
jgi:ribosomal protein S18 acetylase RimI-like enzyme